jgi:hypothetical protein
MYDGWQFEGFLVGLGFGFAVALGVGFFVGFGVTVGAGSGPHRPTPAVWAPDSAAR